MGLHLPQPLLLFDLGSTEGPAERTRRLTRERHTRYRRTRQFASPLYDAADWIPVSAPGILENEFTSSISTGRVGLK